MKKLIVVAVLMLSLFPGCTDDSGSRKALDSAGYTNIELTGYKWWGCSESDSFSTGFNATNPTGKRVSGIVCCGVMKGCTIRF